MYLYEHKILIRHICETHLEPVLLRICETCVQDHNSLVLNDKS